METVAADPDQARERALEAWSPLVALLHPGSRWRRPVLRDGPWPGAGPASVWALSQPLAAAVSLVQLAVVDAGVLEPLRAAVDKYRDGDGFGAFPGERPRYYDDNAWIGLDLVGMHLATGAPEPLLDAARVLAFIGQGEHPEGGVHWVEAPRRARHTCSTAPAAQLALWLHLLTGDTEALAFAERCRAFLMGRLRTAEGLFRDHVGDDGRVDAAVYSYNQGTPIGMDALFFRVTGDAAYLDAAAATAAASIDHFRDGDRLWTHEPCFNAIWFRNLLSLDLHRAQPEARRVLAAYADRLWYEGRDRTTGWFTAGGIGRYERGGVLDQGGIVQVLALGAWPRDHLGDLV